MSDSNIIAPEPVLDFDAWLSTGQRAAHYVDVYARADLLAEIGKIEALLEDNPAPEAGPDTSLGGQHDEFAEERAHLDDLYQRMDASKRTLRVTALTSQEVEELQAQIRVECADQIDKISREAHAEATRTVKRLELKDPNDVNLAHRQAVSQMVQDFTVRELTIRKIARATTAQNTAGEWAPVSLEQVREMYSRLGEAQMIRVERACNTASNEAPQVTAGK